jgi:hypothetical protein
MKSEPSKSSQIRQFLLLRLAVGYLGQKKLSGWWDCDFLDATGLRFLETTFPRTSRLAALRSTTEAACIIHDRALGRVGNYHLFRLPPELEDRLEQEAEKEDWVNLGGNIETRQSAMEVLERLAEAFLKAPAGPVQVGVERKILTAVAVRELAAHYHSAFQDGIRCFPYFAPGQDAP